MKMSYTACILYNHAIGVLRFSNGMLVCSHEEAWPDHYEVLVHAHNKLPHCIQYILSPAYRTQQLIKCEVSTTLHDSDMLTLQPLVC